MLPNPVLSRLSGTTGKNPLFSNPLMSPFDTQVCHERQICLRFHQILKVILKWLFGTLHTDLKSWIEFLWQLLAKMHENAFDGATGSSDAWRLPTELEGGGILCSGAWKCGQASHATVISLCVCYWNCKENFYSQISPCTRFSHWVSRYQ